MDGIMQQLGIDPGILIIALMVLEIVLLVVVFSTSMRVKRMNNRYKSFMKGADGISLRKASAYRSCRPYPT